MLTGNEVGVLLGDDLLRAHPGATVATTIVSSRQLAAIATSRGGRYFETLTGFKWIANGALERQARGERFVFGYEEALGYTVGELVRDKDGISALVAVAELAASLAEHDATLVDRLTELARAHGVFVSTQRSLKTSGPGPGQRLRQQPPSRIAGRPVLSSLDLSAGEKRFADGRRELVGLPVSDVLVYELEGGARVIVRPSGTEPKIKCYYELHVPPAAGEGIAATEARARAGLAELADRHQAELAS